MTSSVNERRHGLFENPTRLEDKPGWTYLHYLVSDPQTSLEEELLLEKSEGSDVPGSLVLSALSIQDSEGQTPLHLAVRNRDREKAIFCIREIEKGQRAKKHASCKSDASGSMQPNLDTQDSHGFTALHHAAHNNDAAIIQQLLFGGASAGLVCNNGLTASQSADDRDYKALAAKLRVRENMPLTMESSGQVVLLNTFPDNALQWLYQNWLPMDAYDNSGMTALHYAARDGNLSDMHALVRSGLPLDLRSGSNATALLYAAQNGHPGIVKWLLETGANADAQDKDGMTALHFAAIKGWSAVARHLMSHGANSEIRASDGLTAERTAIEHCHEALSYYISGFKFHHGYISGTDLERIAKCIWENDVYQQLELDSCFLEPLADPPWGLDYKLVGNRKRAHGQERAAECYSYVIKTTEDLEMIKSFGEECRTIQEERFWKKYFVQEGRNDYFGSGLLTKGDGKAQKGFLLRHYVTKDESFTRSLACTVANMHKKQPFELFENWEGFGFPCSTWIGQTKQRNTNSTSWAKFYSEARLYGVLGIIGERRLHTLQLDRGVKRVIEKVVPRLLQDGHLGGSTGITPTLVHGNLSKKVILSGRVLDSNENFLIDPAFCFAHSEYELGSMTMPGGGFEDFHQPFFKDYHAMIPKTKPEEEYEDRVKLYQLYHWLAGIVAAERPIEREAFMDGAMRCIDDLLEKYGTENESTGSTECASHSLTEDAQCANLSPVKKRGIDRLHGSKWVSSLFGKNRAPNVKKR